MREFCPVRRASNRGCCPPRWCTRFRPVYLYKRYNPVGGDAGPESSSSWTMRCVELPRLCHSSIPSPTFCARITLSLRPRCGVLSPVSSEPPYRKWGRVDQVDALVGRSHEWCEWIPFVRSAHIPAPIAHVPSAIRNYTVCTEDFDIVDSWFSFH